MKEKADLEETVWAVEALINHLIRSTNANWIYPSYVAEVLQIPFALTMAALLEITEHKKLTLYWEVECPECGMLTRELISPYNNAISCARCNRVFDDLAQILPVFAIRQTYRDTVRRAETLCAATKEDFLL